jgi:hypothetical protein
MKIGDEVKCIKQYVYGAGHPNGNRNALIVHEYFLNSR